MAGRHPLPVWSILKKIKECSVNKNTIHAEEPFAGRTYCRQHSSHDFEIPQSGIMKVRMLFPPRGKRFFFTK